MNFILFSLLIGFAGITKALKEPQCFVDGTCIHSQLIDLTSQDNYNDCLENCTANDVCQWFTFDYSANLCFLFVNCLALSNENCANCVSGERTCQPMECDLTGICQVKSNVDYRKSVQ